MIPITNPRMLMSGNSIPAQALVTQRSLHVPVSFSFRFFFFFFFFFFLAVSGESASLPPSLHPLRKIVWVEGVSHYAARVAFSSYLSRQMHSESRKHILAPSVCVA
jgi:hypothetical protein